MNRASGDLDESSRAPAWLDLDKAEETLFPPPDVAPNLSDEALVAFLRVAHLRKVKPVLDKGLDGGRPAPTVTRKELSNLGNAVREVVPTPHGTKQGFAAAPRPRGCRCPLGTSLVDDVHEC